MVELPVPLDLGMCISSTDICDYSGCIYPRVIVLLFTGYLCICSTSCEQYQQIISIEFPYFLLRDRGSFAKQFNIKEICL